MDASMSRSVRRLAILWLEPIPAEGVVVIKEILEKNNELDPEVLHLNREDPAWVENIHELIAGKREAELINFIKEVFSSDLADIIELLDFEEGLYLFTRLPLNEQGEVLYEMRERLGRRYLNEVLSSAEIAAIFEQQPSDRVADLLGILKLPRVGEILVNMPFKDRSQVIELLSYPEDTAGALMDKEFVAVKEDHTIKQAIAALRRAGREIQDVHTIYVVDQQGRYRGNVSLIRMILSRPQTRIKRIMEDEILPIPVYMDKEEVANFFTRYDFITAPVVDDYGTMLGRITVDDILEVVQEEASEDILRMGGVSGEETLDTPIWKSSLRRVVWLCLNLCMAFLSVSVIQFFETTISKIVILASLMPIVAGLGGNAGGQTMALIVRNIALGEIKAMHTARTLGREVSIGVLNGLLVGLLTAVVVYMLTESYGLSIIIFLALVLNLIVAAFAGTLFPLFLKKIGVDPAIASSILVTTCTDVLGFFMFLGLAYLLLPVFN